MGAIYKITNLINNKIYIGKTIRNPKTRWSEHLQYSRLTERYNTPLYNAMRKYGVENFSFQVIEDNIISENELNEKERFYISKYHSTSHENGYNVVLGGDGGRTSSKLTQVEVNQIKEILSNTDNIQSFSEIGKIFNISSSVIQSINTGKCWYDSKTEYPIRKYDTTGLTLTRQEYLEIINDIMNTTLSLTEISKKYDLSESRMTAINQGKECYTKENLYYKGIYNGDFPIRKDKRTKTPDNDYIPIFYDVLFTKDSMAKIGERHNVAGNTIQCVVTGKRRKELTKNFILPMRSYLEENQKIFNELYPNFERR